MFLVLTNGYSTGTNGSKKWFIKEADTEEEHQKALSPKSTLYLRNKNTDESRDDLKEYPVKE